MYTRMHVHTHAYTHAANHIHTHKHTNTIHVQTSHTNITHQTLCVAAATQKPVKPTKPLRSGWAHNLSSRTPTRTELFFMYSQQRVLFFPVRLGGLLRPSITPTKLAPFVLPTTPLARTYPMHICGAFSKTL